MMSSTAKPSKSFTRMKRLWSTMSSSSKWWCCLMRRRQVQERDAFLRIFVYLPLAQILNECVCIVHFSLWCTFKNGRTWKANPIYVGSFDSFPIVSSLCKRKWAGAELFVARKLGQSFFNSHWIQLLSPTKWRTWEAGCTCRMSLKCRERDFFLYHS